MNKHIIDTTATIIQALEKLNALSGSVMTLLVTKADGKLAGTLTDGDVRRGLLKGCATNTNVLEVANTKFTAVKTECTPLERLEIIRNARHMGIKLLPEIDSDGRLVGVVDLTITRSVLPLSAILMAGGLGERLRPLTLKCPKPLIEVGGRAIIDYNMENLARHGISNVFIMVRYLADQIREYFRTTCHGIQATCVEETLPMGTLGAATLAPLPAEGNTLIMNSDLLTTINLEEMYMRHIDTEADITIAAIPYTSSVPYAILNIDGDYVTDIAEKPTTTHFANAGIYIFSNRLLAKLPKNQRTDAPDFILQAISEGNRVSYYPISGTWIDIGSPQEYAHANDLMRHHKSLTKMA